MLGAIIGDIVGSTYEFNPTNEFNFDLFPPGSSFTDDTICTVAVADALLSDNKFGEKIHQWCQRYPHPKGGYGGRFAAWVRSAYPQPYGSFGNGSAMRVSPVGWWSKDMEEVKQLAKSTAECTHNHPYGIAGAQAVAVAIADCRALRADKPGSEFSRAEILSHGLANALRIFPGLENPRTFSLDLEMYRNVFDETCQGTVPVAFEIIAQSNSFEVALRKAVSLGADADTLGAIVGSIAEAIWDIPSWIKEAALDRLPDEMLSIVERFEAAVKPS